MGKKYLLVTLIIGILFLSSIEAKAQNKYLIIPIENFHGASSDMEWSRMCPVCIAPGVTYPYLYMKGITGGFLQAGFNLPHAAQIKMIHMIFVDNHVSDIILRVKRHNIWTGQKETIFSYATSGSADFIRTVGTSAVLVSGGRYVFSNVYNYSVELYFPDAANDMGWPYKFVYGIRITYE